jgi:hypothetical protein
MKYSFFLIFILLASCGGDNFNKVEVLKGFRILSVVMTTPATDSEVQAGDSVTLQLYVSDAEGAVRTQPILGTTTSCIDPGISLGAKVNCDHDPSAITAPFTLNTNTADLAANLNTGLALDTVNVNVPSSASIFLGRSAREQFNGVSYIVIFNFTVDGKEVSAFKRIVATNRSPLNLNQNPSGSSILLNGTAIATAPSENDILEVTSNLPETYEYITLDGITETRTEELAVAWFVTQGEFDKPKSDVNESVKYLGSAPTVPSIVLTVVRDRRGGVEIVRRKL